MMDEFTYAECGRVSWRTSKRKIYCSPTCRFEADRKRRTGHADKRHNWGDLAMRRAGETRASRAR